MTPQEQDIIGRFIARVGGATAPQSLGASVPATRPDLPPVDPEADRFIATQFSSYPEARYRVTQMAFVQEAALAEAQNRIKQLEYQLNQAQQALQQAQQAPQPTQSRGLFGGLFGGSQQSAPPYPPQPQYAQPQYAQPPQASYPPGYQPGMFGRGGGSGFLGSALTTAAGVAGGVLAADAITSMFSGHGGGYGGFGGGGFGGGFGGGEVVNETVVNNYGTDAGASDPWAGSGTTDAAAGGWSDAPQGDVQGSDAWSGGGDAAGGGGDFGGDSGGWDSGGGSDDSSF